MNPVDVMMYKFNKMDLAKKNVEKALRIHDAKRKDFYNWVEENDLFEEIELLIHKEVL